MTTRTVINLTGERFGMLTVMGQKGTIQWRLNHGWEAEKALVGDHNE